MTDEELNDALRKIADLDENSVDSPMGVHGKVLPYRGWYWRNPLNWSSLPVSQCDGMVLIDVAGKWLDPRWNLNEKMSARARELAEEIAAAATAENVRAWCEFLNSQQPPAEAVEESARITESYRELTRKDPSIGWSP